jgi:hypothetical protein
MLLLQALLTALLHSVGRILNLAFGWATVLFFGKVPGNRQTALSVMAFGSVLWLTLALGIAFPRLGAFLLTFNPLSSRIDEASVRALMLILALILPAVIGLLALFVVGTGRPYGVRSIARTILRGYPYTLGLSTTLVLMIVFAPVLRLRDLLRRWDSAHVPMIVEPKNYLEVVAAIQQILQQGGHATRQAPPGLLLRVPTIVFTFFARAAADRLVAGQLVILKSPQIEVLLHPSDLVISGREADVGRTRAILTEHLTFTKAYQTWSLDGNRLEDRLVDIWRRHNQGGRGETLECLKQLEAIDKDAKQAVISYEEWEVLFREKLVVERQLLSALAGLGQSAVDPDSLPKQNEPASCRRAQVR